MSDVYILTLRKGYETVRVQFDNERSAGGFALWAMLRGYTARCRIGEIVVLEQTEKALGMAMVNLYTREKHEERRV